jgi:uncharacterized protein with FMN-binding domain
MKRAPTILTATAAGLAATLGFTPHKATPTAAATASSSPQPSSSSSSAKKSSSSSSSSASTMKTVTGDASTQYGEVTLKVTISGGKITKIEPVALPENDPRSMQISSYAEPLLRQSALSKQSANIDAVSGATYTSNGYATALQAALDQAGFQGQTNAAG